MLNAYCNRVARHLLWMVDDAVAYCNRVARHLLWMVDDAVAGLSDVHALPLAVTTCQACHFIGLPECAVCIITML